MAPRGTLPGVHPQHGTLHGPPLWPHTAPKGRPATPTSRTGQPFGGHQVTPTSSFHRCFLEQLHTPTRAGGRHHCRPPPAQPLGHLHPWAPLQVCHWQGQRDPALEMLQPSDPQALRSYKEPWGALLGACAESWRAPEHVWPLHRAGWRRWRPLKGSWGIPGLLGAHFEESSPCLALLPHSLPFFLCHSGEGEGWRLTHRWGWGALAWCNASGSRRS